MIYLKWISIVSLFLLCIILGLCSASYYLVRGYVPIESNLTFIDDFYYDGVRYKTMEDAYSGRRWIVLQYRDKLIVVENGKD